MTTIYNKQGTEVVTIPTIGTKRRVLMSENSIKLEFEHINYFDFALGSYIVYEYSSDPLLVERFDIISPSIPEICKDGFKYSLTFEAAECQLKRFNIFYDEGESSEVAFALSDEIDAFGNLIAKCANKYISTISWSYGGCNLKIEGFKTLSFKGDKIYECLNMVAEAFDCEWWTETNCGYDIVTGKLKTDVHIWFGKLSVGSEVDFEVDKAVSSMQRQGGDNTNYGTRFFCFGSTKNLTSDYGQSDIKSGVAEIRLHLPKGTPYIDTKEGLTNEEIIHQTVFFDDIYPKNTDIVTKVETEKRKVEGSETQKTFDAYIVTADATPFVPSDIIEGEEFRILFTSGNLWGEEFEVCLDPKYDPKKWKEGDGFDKRFEIKPIEQQGDGEIFFIPNESIKPIVTDTFILKGVKLAKERVAEAEAELLAEGRKWAIKNSADTDVYNCPINPVHCIPNDLSYDLGQKVRLKDRRFSDGGRSSRIMGYEKSLENKYVGSYTVGDNTTYSHLGKMESDIKASQYTERVGVDAGGTHIITKYDNTMPSDSNLYSALKTMLTFAKLNGGNLLRGMQRYADGMMSNDFLTGLTGRGFQIKKDEYGKWRGEIDSLTVREFLEVPELRFNRVDVVSGELWNAIAFGTIESVDKINQIATVKLLEGEILSVAVNDICRGIFYNLGSDKDTDDGNGFKQMKGFGTAYFTPKEILPDGKSFRYELQSGSSFHPCKAMKFVAYGNFSDVTRQASAYQTRTYTRYIEKVNTWAIDPDRNIVAQYGDIDGLTIGGVTMKGTGSFQKNSYLSGVQIQFTPEQKEDLKGDDAYSVSLSSYEGVIKMSGDGVIANTLQEYNIISGENNVVLRNENLITTSYTLSTRIQAFKGAEELTYDVTPSKGSYVVSMTNVGCSALISGGVLYILSVEDREKAYVDLTVNCEGHAIFSKRYSIVVVADGKDGSTFEFIYKRTATEEKPTSPPTAQTDDYVPEGWTDDPVGVDSTMPYEWICRRDKREGVWSAFSTVSLWATYSTNGDGYVTVYKRSETKPSKPEGTDLVPYGWEPAMVNTDNGIKSIDNYNNWKMRSTGYCYQSPTTIGFTKNRINIVTTKPNMTITLHLGINSNLNTGNLGVVGLLDREINQNTVNFADSIGVYNGESNSYYSYITIASEGNHFVEIGYFLKKRSTTVTDLFEYKVLSAPTPFLPWWCSSSVILGSTHLSDGNWSDPVLSTGMDAVMFLESSVSQIGCNSLGSFEPSSFEVTFYKQYGDHPKIKTSAYLAVYGYDGERWVHIVNPSFKTESVTVIADSRYLQYCIKAHTSPNPAYSSIHLGMVTVNVVEEKKNSASRSMPRNCGKYDPNAEYVYDKYFRDCCYVVDGGVAMPYMRSGFATLTKGVHPVGSDKWEKGNKEIFTAIDTDLIDGADIAGFLFKGGVMQSRDTNTDGTPKLSLNGKTGSAVAYDLTAVNANISGTINALAGIFGGMMQVKFKSLEDAAIDSGDGMSYTMGDYFNLSANQKGNVMYKLTLPDPSLYEGATINIFNSFARTKSTPSVLVKGSILHKDYKDNNGSAVRLKSIHIIGGIIQFIAIDRTWIVTYETTLNKIVNY